MPACRRPRKKSKSRKRRCLRPGPISRNPYLNFLRDFRRKCCGLSAVKTVQQGAKAWKSLNKQDKLSYIEKAFYAPKRKRRTLRSLCAPRRRKPAKRARRVSRCRTICR